MEPVLLGFSANTGHLLCSADGIFALAYGVGQSASLVPVTRERDSRARSARGNREACPGGEHESDQQSSAAITSSGE